MVQALTVPRLAGTTVVALAVAVVLLVTSALAFPSSAEAHHWCTRHVSHWHGPYFFQFSGHHTHRWGEHHNLWRKWHRHRDGRMHFHVFAHVNCSR